MTRLGALVLLGALLGAFGAPAGAAPSPPSAPAPGSVADLEQRLRDAQAASNAAVARFQQATARHEALIDQINAVEQRIAAARTRAAELRAIVTHRAVVAYTTRETGDVTSAVLSGDDLLTGIRRSALLERANAKDDAAIAQLRVLDQDLGIQKADLAQKREEAARLVAQLEAEKAVLASSLAEAQRAYDELVARLAREAASRAAAERAAQLAAAAAARRTAPVTGTPVGGFLCPVRGSFTDDYGDPRSGGRSHTGIDIFAPTGTPVVAVKSGSLVLESGGAGGNAAYLNAGDGNTYYYAHFSSYAGPGRQVAQGEVVGYVGQTGNASTPHLHFEIRTPSGPINPYPTLVASC